jgi:hypothetical protein
MRRHFPRNSHAIFAQYISERPADFAKATTAKEVEEGQNYKQKKIKRSKSCHKKIQTRSEPQKEINL